MCGIKKQKQELYNLYPHPAVYNLLIDQAPKVICKKCIKRELGKKHLKELNELEENS